MEESLTDYQCSAAALIDAGRSAALARLKPQAANVPNAVPFIVAMDENGAEKPVFLREVFDAPKRKTGTVKLSDADSFVKYFNQHGGGKQSIYATLQPARFVAVLNDHTADAPGFRDHRADFTVAFSREYKAWKEMDGKAFDGNEAFAYFLEDNLPDIIKPSGNDMLAIALNFKVNQQVKYGNLARLQDGNTELTYNNIVDASSTSDRGGKIKIPESFTLEIPIFDGLHSAKYKIEARFRFRLFSGALTLKYELTRPHKAIEAAFKELWTSIEKQTKASILHGTPE